MGVSGEGVSEFLLAKEAGRRLSSPLDERENEITAAAGIAHGPDGGRLGELLDPLKRAEAGHRAAVGLRHGLGGGDSDPGSIVASRSGAHDHGGKPVAGRKLPEESAEGRKKVAFLGALTGK
jgi:hypothetical protein